MTKMNPVMEQIFTKIKPCPGAGILNMIPCSAARPRTENYMSTPPPGVFKRNEQDFFIDARDKNNTNQNSTSVIRLEQNSTSEILMLLIVQKKNCSEFILIVNSPLTITCRSFAKKPAINFMH